MNLFEYLKPLVDFFVKPFTELLNYYNLSDKTFGIGFGSVEWFNFQLVDLFNLVIGTLVVIFIMIIFYKFIRFFFRMFGGGWL